jgi:hypothetical protein
LNPVAFAVSIALDTDGQSLTDSVDEPTGNRNNVAIGVERIQVSIV